jgi:hypothetical protein
VDEVDPIGPKEIYSPGESEMEALSQIIRELNEHFGTEFNDDDKLCIRELEHRLVSHAALEASVRANTLQNAGLTVAIGLPGLRLKFQEDRRPLQGGGQVDKQRAVLPGSIF